MIIDSTSHKEYMQELKADEYRENQMRNNRDYNPRERTTEYYLKLGFTLEKAILFSSWE